MRFEVSFLVINIMRYKQKEMHMTITNHDKIELFEYSHKNQSLNNIHEENISSRLKLINCLRLNVFYKMNVK